MPFFYYFQLPDITYKVLKVLNLGQKSDIDILCFLHVLKVPESEKVVFKRWSVCKHSSTQTKRAMDLKFYIRVTYAHGTQHEVLRKNHAWIPAIELFRF